jgi:Domain of unknown function (DUF4389)
MLTYEVQYQPEYSRGELLLRTFFGWLYMGIPHFILLMLLGIAFWFMTLASFFIILFTGVTPKWYYEWAVKMQRWGLRLGARMSNLADGYPKFGMDATDDKTVFEVSFWQISRGQLLLRSFLGFFLLIPHLFALYIRCIATWVLSFLAFFAVLFTGKYPENWHRFNVGTMRWGARVNLYMTWLYKDYPPFAGKPDENPLKDLDHLNK